ncbi:hypothetical protein BD779DRAFT_1607574 [Infundibulicybe gibba]|nr:hypothetical protein BD779DRAFT_1607574 [Infundibulicybe gibba]
MVAQKRSLDDASANRKAKKVKTAERPATEIVQEVDFPRGGGTSFTPLEVKAIRAEAVKEANDELFEESALQQDAQKEQQSKKKGKRKSEANSGKPGAKDEKHDRIRIEHLNYKRLFVGMKIFGQIASVQPLALIISLPNQLFAHVPITNISDQFTALLEGTEDDDDDDNDDDDSPKSQIPDLVDIFQEGQYIRAVVTVVHAQGSTDMSGIGKSRDEVARASRRVELSLVPGRVNAGLQKLDLKSGFTVTAAIKSIEDHGYILDLGLPDVSGFLPFKGIKKNEPKMQVGRLLDTVVVKLSGNGRTCNVSIDSTVFTSASISEVATVQSVLPGTLVQALITAVHPTGLNLQVLGFFEGTVESLHLCPDATEKTYKIGKKVKARILYNLDSTPPTFSLALTEHVLNLGVRAVKNGGKSLVPMRVAYPIGTLLEDAKVLKVEAERGLMLGIAPGVEGFVHISHASDDHIPSLSSSGPWKPGSIHRARVIGHFLFDGTLQLSLKSSVLEQKFLQVTDINAGEVIKGTIKKLTDSGLFISISSTIDGVVWPNHYADIALKHPTKRFKVGASIKCRALMVDPDRKRISLTAKRTLVDSTLPILSKVEDAKVGMVAHAVVFKVFDNQLLVEFYNNLKGLIPAKEVSEIKSALPISFPVGKVVKVRIISVESESNRIIASIRQAAATSTPIITDISSVEIGNIVEGSISEIHKDNAVLDLHPSRVRALISLKNLANHRNVSLVQLRLALTVGDKLDALVVVTRNIEKGFVIVASKPKAKASLPTKGSLSIDTVKIGQIVGGRVTRYARGGALVKLASHLGGTLHPTDTSDNYDTGNAFPAVDSVLKAVVVGVDQVKKQLTLSTRHSRMYPDNIQPIVDREIGGVHDLQVGDTIQGFVKSVVEHGLFVSVCRDIDARVQIRELFDEYVKDWKVHFKVNQLVKGRILSVDPETKKVELSFRTGILTKPLGTLTVGDLQKGQKIDGIVKRIENYGLFIQIEGSKIHGLCHKSELSDNQDADVTVALSNFREGDHVKAYITDITNRRVSLSLKPSRFVEEDFETQEQDSEHLGAIENMSQDEDEGDDSEMASVPSDNEDENDSEGDEDAMRVDMDDLHSLPSPHSSKPAITNNPTLKLSGFQWSDNTRIDEEDKSDSSSEDSEREGPSDKKKKRKKKRIEQDLTADMHTKTPESNADFERHLLGSPNSSFLWIQYMSFQLQLSEVEKAREVARRALQTINFREEQEKLNVWIAFLNLENVYGTDETLDTAFKEAARANDSKTIHIRLASILTESGKHEKAEEQYKRTCKKFGQSSKAWTLFDIEASRKLLPRSLQSLDKRKHLKTISRFAQLEYKLGDPERGKTVFEGVVESHPKRWDLWSIYMDMEAGQGNIQTLRNLFDRIFLLKMTSHKAKSFFKKWLELERRLGDEEGASGVKQKAIEWTQRANS